MALACAMTLVAASMASLPGASAEDATLIVPGRSLGPARIGMTVAELATALGPSRPGLPGTLVFALWGITALVQDGVAARLSTSSPQYRTTEGAGVGVQPGQATRLVGDINSFETRSGLDTTVLYPFQGVGFVFRGGRAVETFVVPRIVIGPAAPRAAAAPGESEQGIAAPAAPTEGVPAPGGPATAPGASSAAASLASLTFTDLTAAVETAGPLLRVAGKLVNTGTQSLDAVTLTVVFHRSSGDDIQKDVAATAPAQGETPFGVTTSVASDLVTTYTLRVSAGAARPVEETHEVPVAAYTELAKQKIQVDVQLGAPAVLTVGVQALVSIKDTTPIPTAWVKDALVYIPFGSASGVQNGLQVRVAPNQTVTVIIPAVPSPGGVQGPGGPLPQGSLIAPLTGQPRVLDVTLRGS